MAEERLKRNLDIALDAGPDFPNQLWLSRTMAAIEKEAPRSTGARGIGGNAGVFDLLSRSRRLAAVVALIALAVAATAGLLAIHSKFGPAPAHVPKYGVRSPGTPVCAQNCNFGIRVFTSETVGWVIESRASGCTTQACVGTPGSDVAELFETTDGGTHWRPALNLGSHSAQQILTSSDGSTVLIVGAPYDAAPMLFRSTDRGHTWRTFRYPAGSGSRPPGDMTVCGRVAPRTFFLNPNEGWVIAQTDTYGSDQVFHTSDGGSSWALTGAFDIKSQLNTDVVAGLPCKLSVTHELPGDFQFEDSTTGWYLPYSGSSTTALLYRTQDGGLHWQQVSVSIPASPAQQYPAIVTSLSFFNRTDGAAVVTQEPGTPIQYIIQTSDGGVHWGQPLTPPMEGPIEVIDATHWAGLPYGGGWMRTSDAGQQWEVVRRPAGAPDDTTVVPNAGLPDPFYLGGQSWHPSLFQFLNPAVGFANIVHESCQAGSCESAGMSLYKTSDGGTSWTPLSLPDWF